MRKSSVLLYERCSWTEDQMLGLASALPLYADLKSVSFSGMRFSDHGACVMFASLPESLQSFNATFFNSSPAFAQAVAEHLPSLKHLTTFSSHGNNVGDEASARIIESLPRSLEFLLIGFSGMGPEAGAALAAMLLRLPRLATVYVDNNRIGSSACAALCSSFDRCPHVKVVSLRNCFDDADITSLVTAWLAAGRRREDLCV